MAIAMPNTIGLPHSNGYPFNEILNENKPANENWLGEMGKSSGTPTQTLYRWWDAVDEYVPAQHALQPITS